MKQEFPEFSGRSFFSTDLVDATREILSLILKDHKLVICITFFRQIIDELSISTTFSICNTSYHFRVRKKSARYENQGYK